MSTVVFSPQTPDTSAAFCTKCGNKMQRSDNFCIRCGTRNEASAAASAPQCPPAQQEAVLMTILRATDTLWGGFVNLHITDRRIVVETVMKSTATAAAFAAGGLAGIALAQNVAGKRAQQMHETGQSLDQILASSAKNYALAHGEISALLLKKKGLPLGCSRMKIKSSSKNVTYAFKREMFEEVAATLNRLFPGKVSLG